MREEEEEAAGNKTRVVEETEEQSDEHANDDHGSIDGENSMSAPRETERIIEEEQIQQPIQPSLRASQRQITKPKYLEDYVLLSSIECEHLLMVLNDEPWDFNEAKESKEWREACEEEISSITKNKTWNLVELLSGAKAIGLKWVFKIKRNSDGSINKFKARLVAKGYV